MKTTIAPKSENLRMNIPGIEQVRSYFSIKDYSIEEADLFFFYYQSLGWRNENGTPLRDWKSAASSWMWNLEN
ncbi:hypothetical protein A33Q_1599 [Indibacter alkaliphilus LW1]|uniref:Uncharacterized protein n=1 Tax=Indibacter alkaliphilus (strain CCUG 57479 / KCTC 22604 / LW1) TaxID=1189612 RepID=S2DKN9_INDAL|nr:hypothetical protein [Indibacter alkaliphilus]EOZ97790.1 hypothetical protein A33Q_1599 [Indibacter alkaliphilus LW1]